MSTQVVIDPLRNTRQEVTSTGRFDESAQRDAALVFIGHYELAMSGTTIYHIYDIVGGGTAGSQGNKNTYAALSPTPRTADISFRVAGSPRGTLAAYLVWGDNDPANPVNPSGSWGDTIYSEEHWNITQTDMTIVKFRNSSADALCIITLWA